MRLMLHIFARDVRRLWREIVVTVALVSALAWTDIRRLQAMPGQAEIALNVLLPAVWAFLIALLVHGEPLVGDRQFWLTRPYRWRALLASKALFALVFVHAASLMADLVVVVARGFGPLESLPPLLWKQILLAAALTLPAAALAAVTATLPQFTTLMLALVAGGLVLWARLEPVPFAWMKVDWARRGMAWLPLTGAAMAMVLSQYARKRAMAAWAVLGVAFLVSALAYGYLPREFTFRVQCAFFERGGKPAAASVVLDAAGPPAALWMPPPPGTVALAIPIRVAGIDQETRVILDLLALEVRGGGETWRPTVRPGRAQPPRAALWMDRKNAGAQILTLDRPLYERLQSREVTVSGRAALIAFREESPVSVPALAGGVDAPPIGRCSSFILDEVSSGQILIVSCVSPRSMPRLIHARFSDPAAGQVWKQQMDVGTFGVVPAPDWFSPLYRRQGSFHFVSDAVPKGSITITSERESACAIVRYELRNLDLRRYLLSRVLPSRLSVRP